MSTDFMFWRTTQTLDPVDVAEHLYNDEPVEGLDTLDLDAAEQALIAAFPGWIVEARRADGHDQTMLGAPDQQGGLDVRYTPQSVSCSCYGMDNSQFNLVIEAMISQNLPLFDPQINERFVI